MILHVVPGLNQCWNGIAGAAKDIARSQGADLVETMEFARGRVSFEKYDEIWVHSNWWPPTLMACVRVILARKTLVRMTHANLDPLRYHFKWIKKFAVSFVERWIFRHTSRVVVTCEAEREWCVEWGVKGPFELFDLKRFYEFSKPIVFPKKENPLTPIHVLYLGRRHPLKGVKYLQLAVSELNTYCRARVPGCGNIDCVELKIVSDVYDSELDKMWEWSDILVLPTLSENFGRVVAEALERGRPVITTDGAPAWADLSTDRGCYLVGYREGSEEKRVALLRQALSCLVA